MVPLATLGQSERVILKGGPGNFKEISTILRKSRHDWWVHRSSYIHVPVLSRPSSLVKVPIRFSPDFHGFCHRWSVGRWSPYYQPTFWRFFSSWSTTEGRPIIGCQSADDRQVGRWHFIKEPSTDRHRVSAVIRPMTARLSADHKLWIVSYCLQCMYPH